MKKVLTLRYIPAYIVDPEFIDHDQLSNEEVSRGFCAVVKIFSCGDTAVEDAITNELVIYQGRKGTFSDDAAWRAVKSLKGHEWYRTHVEATV